NEATTRTELSLRERPPPSNLATWGRIIFSGVFFSQMGTWREQHGNWRLPSGLPQTIRRCDFTWRWSTARWVEPYKRGPSLMLIGRFGASKNRGPPQMRRPRRPTRTRNDQQTTARRFSCCMLVAGPNRCRPDHRHRAETELRPVAAGGRDSAQ